MPAILLAVRENKDRIWMIVQKFQCDLPLFREQEPIFSHSGVDDVEIIILSTTG
ncbi:MAG: hypothetical protein JSU77_10525 [Fidelibacterota bacterium]|nr:MAG: hypothetical protein JSU77_10525 [Candidatus Neomarinimicrobiota bacterium]